MQVPGISSDNVLPETKQTEVVEEEKVIGRLELAAADSVSCVRAYCVPVIGVKLIVWVVKRTAKLCAAAIGAYELLPACEAKTMQVPCVSIDSVLPETEQTEEVVEENVTGRLELAVAERDCCVPTYCVPVMGVKLMV